MALINCPECQKEISDQAKKCPNCGVSVKKEIARIKSEEISKTVTTKEKVIAFVIILAIIIFIAYACNRPENPPTKSGYLHMDDDYFFYATGAAVDIVENHLKYPKNAEFQDQGKMHVYYDSSNEEYTITGYVYASNAFGVKSKNNFTVRCTIRVSGDSYYYTEKYCNIE